MGSDVARLFAAEGPLARALPDYAHRPEQAAMAVAVARAIERGEPLLVEAGTGIGKTFAYLVPALLSGRRVIVSTGTRTLQDQLYRRDLPLLARALGSPVRVALLKGRANYLCRHRLELAVRQRGLPGFERAATRTLARVERWAASTRAGDLAELTDLPEHSPLWPQITSTRENCLGAECRYHAECHVLEARREAQAADLVVVNHHLLLADLALKDEGFGDLLPGADAVILDEAHQVPEIAAQFFGRSWSTRQVDLLVRDAQAEIAAAAVDSGRTAATLGELTERCAGLRRALGSAPSRVEWARVPDAFVEELEAIERALGECDARLQELAAGAALTACARRARAAADSLAALRACGDEDGLRWVECGPAAITLQFTPFEIAERLREAVQGQGSAWIFTSATLAVAGDFAHFAARVGLADARAFALDSPFDYARQARILLPSGMPDPQSGQYPQAFVEAVAPLLEAGGGRAFLLFTSHRALGEGLAALERRFPQPPFPVLVQGQAPREALLARFRELGRAVLLATASFWEGVDVKGDALAIVAIDKLPFASPDDPLLAARLEGIRRRGGNGFTEHQLPQAVLALKQGAGRLIRDFDDFGVIVIGDPRIARKSYGRAFLAALPPCPVLTDPAEAARFLAGRLAAHARQRANPASAANSASEA
ncbi:MAG: ATP-dependent DNA helicase [Gammaproteobacteria bacterium]|nr:ATP-dependent DNA helicase [Gammaproteobacteria bacterium]